jgi:hypothetical protein
MSKKNIIMEKVTHQSDEIAAGYWKLAASDRGREYKRWLNILRNASQLVKNDADKHNL